MWLTKAQKKMLGALLQGATLKSHRYLDGIKVYQLHALDGTSETVAKRTVIALRLRGYLQSNHKFPAATYVLTAKGRQAISPAERT